MTTPLLEIKDLVVDVSGKTVINGISLTVHRGEIHAIMGPNGAGKSSIAHIIAGDPRYMVVSGDVLYQGESILHLPPEERALRGIFISFQHPLELPGIQLTSFLKAMQSAVRKRKGEPVLSEQEAEIFIEEKMKEIHSLFLKGREVNVGFSGGEKKRAELLQMAVLNPLLPILDEIDSGLDIDSLKSIAAIISSQCEKRSCILVTHYKRLLEYITPHHVHVMVQGKIVRSGGYSLVDELEEQGYARWV